MKHTVSRSLAGVVLLLSITVVSCDEQIPVEGNAPDLGLMRPQLGPGESNWTAPTDVDPRALLTTTTDPFGLTVTDDIAALDLVNALVIPGPDAPIVSNATFTGAAVAAGIFSGGTGIIGIESGIVLSSGNVGSVVGTNTSSSITTNNGLGGDGDLGGLISGLTSE